MKTKPSLLLLFTVTLLNAQWTQTNGPSGGTIISVSAKGSTIFASVMNGSLQRSMDGGTSWEVSNSGIWDNGPIPKNGVEVSSVAAIGSNFFASSRGGGVFRSLDIGKTWTEIDSGLTNRMVFSLFVVGSKIFAASHFKLFLSTNNGDVWVPADSGLPKMEVSSITAIGEYSFAAVNGSGVYRSTNNAISWSLSNSGLIDSNVTSLVVIGTNLFAGTFGNGVFISTDNGTHWDMSNNGLNNKFVRSLAVLGTTLFAGTDSGGVYSSTDNGVHWNQVNTGLTKLTVSTLTANGTELIAGLNYEGGLCITKDNGLHWSMIGMPTTTVSSFLVSGENLYAATWGNGIFKSTNNGVNWISCNNGISHLQTYVQSLAIQDMNLFAGTAGSSIFRSTNSGINWELVDSCFTDVTNKVSSFTISGQNIYASVMGSSPGGVFLSTDKGTSWSERDSGITNKNVNCLASKDHYLFAGLSPGIYSSTNNGLNWNLLGLNNLNVNPIVVHDSMIYAGTNQGLYQSSDKGINWTRHPSFLTGGTISCLTVQDTNIIVGNFMNGLVVASTKNSRAKTVGFEGKTLMSITVKGDYIFAGTIEDGVWKRPLKEIITSMKEVTSTTPRNYILEQNYPNPFNPATTISYSLPLTGAVTLKVFDLVGRETATLVNEIQEVGDHFSTFNASTLPSGIYFYKIHARGFMQVKKMVLLK